MVVTWVVARLVGRYSVIDVAWGLGFITVAATSFGWSSGHGDDTNGWLVLVLVRGVGTAPRHLHRLAQPWAR